MSPARVVASWPEGESIVALVSGTSARGGGDWSRWSILARPARTIITPALGNLADVEQDLAALEPSFRGVGPGAGWLGPEAIEPGDPPVFASGWIGWISYSLGALLEPALEPQRRSDWPLMVWHRCEGALVHDGATGRWRSIGTPGIERAWTGPRDRPAVVGPSLVTTARAAYETRVARAIEYIRAGDVYQVNLAHTIDAPLEGPARSLSGALWERSHAWYGAHVEHTDPDGRRRTVCSASPELFLEIAPVRGGGGDRRIVTRPMKGTLAGDQDPRTLERSPKDRAELDMIVDLMRNDLGRICRTGSVRVEERRAIEPHGGLAAPDKTLGAPARPSRAGVWQGVATVSGAMRRETRLIDLLRAVFPAGSVTGAPKIRAMQIIEELEDRPRGPYCGCVGYIGDDGRVGLSVAIRTALAETPPPGGGPPMPSTRSASRHAMAPGLVSYSVGAGIVADSEPAREWSETMQKAGILLDLAAGTGTVRGVIVSESPAIPDTQT